MSKNRHTISEFLILGISTVLTKIFYPGAKLICYPCYIRGKKSMKYGKGLNLGYHCRFDLLNSEKITLYLGENCEMGEACHIVAKEKVEIGDNFLAASKVFISDTNHGNYSSTDGLSAPVIAPNDRPLVTNSVNIGKNVWIGENVVILAGSQIGDGCIIGANSVVNGCIKKNSIAVGSPARVVKRWNEATNRWERVNGI